MYQEYAFSVILKLSQTYLGPIIFLQKIIVQQFNTFFPLEFCCGLIQQVAKHKRAAHSLIPKSPLG